MKIKSLIASKFISFKKLQTPKGQPLLPGGTMRQMRETGREILLKNKTK
jgi:hypothetical protein